MSLKSAPFFWLECDRCGKRSTEGSEYVAWQQDWFAVEDAVNSDWHVEGGNHLCPDCTPMARNDDDIAQVLGAGSA